MYLCNAEVASHVFDDNRHYSTYQRALKGKSAWEEILQPLDGLMSMQIAHSRKYLPKDDPPEDQLASWMKQVAGVPWWFDVLKPDVPLGSFKAWYSPALFIESGRDWLRAPESAVDSSC